MSTFIPPGAASAIEAVEGGPSPADMNGVEALGGFSMKLGSMASTGGSAAGKVWGEGGVGVGAGGEGGVGVGRVGGTDSEGGATLLLLVIRPSSVASLSSSSSWTT